jgi:O-antigen/teichoic acid export membrane protein
MSRPSETAANTLLDDAPVYGSFISGVALTFATRLLMLAGVFGSGVIIARRLGAEGFGTLAVLNVTVALALQVGSAGLPSANTYFIARDRQTLGPIWANAIVFGLVAGAILALGIMALAWVKPSLLGGVSITLLLLAVVSIPFQLLTLLGLNVLLAMDRIRQLNLFDSLAPAFALLNAIVVLIVLRERLPLLVSFNTAAAIVLSLGLSWYLGRLVKRQAERQAGRPSFQLWKAMLSYGVKFYVSIMAGAIIFRADLLIVNHFRGQAEAGVYAVASQVSFLLLMLPGVIATLLFPRVASSQDQRGEFAVRVTRHTTLMMFALCAAAAIGSFILPFVYGAQFSDATIQLLILLPGVLLVGLESVLVQHFTGTGLPLAIPMFWLITLAVNVGLNLMTVPRFGARGAAVNSTISYALIFFLVAIYFRAKTGRTFTETFLVRNHELRTLLSPARWRASPTKAPQ